ncbi:tyrosine-protein phosphatase [Paraliobacillus sp. X-1268]|uniref:tyrosine-protein phosphatase n=1 Tax=Paraliobacillus sp. X-1268 TaxID=2213193 RepID=UPI000E3DB3F3|nr:CpsB/CapC family capsule biosynthesis tyrosine phosphatase [Paraliobacillus sp. X-1268]
MIDINCHILPGIDNGPKHIEESVAIAKTALAQGIETIVATPKHMNGQYHNFKQQIIQQVDTLNQRLQEEQLALTVLPGQEIRIYGEMIESLEKDHLLTINETPGYLLMDLPSNHIPAYMMQLIFNLQIKGYKPIIAHPETNPFIREDPDLLYELVKQGALVQLATDSIIGKNSRKTQKFTLEIMKARLAHFIGSEASKASGYSYQEALRKVRKHFGNEMTYFFYENAMYLTKGEAVITEEPVRMKKKRLDFLNK